MTIEEVVARAREDDVRLVRFLYCDPSGVIRGKNVHVDRLAEPDARGRRPDPRPERREHARGSSCPSRAWSRSARSASCPTRTPTACSPGCPAPPACCATSSATTASDWGSCTRSFLKRAIAEAAERMGIRVMAAFENEFYLAQEVDGVVRPYQDGPVYSSAGMDRVAHVMDDIVDALEAQGLEVEQAINEYGPGQQEIAIRYADALRAADNQLKFRDTVRGVAEVAARAHRLVRGEAVRGRRRLGRARPLQPLVARRVAQPPVRRGCRRAPPVRDRPAVRGRRAGRTCPPSWP